MRNACLVFGALFFAGAFLVPSGLAPEVQAWSSWRLATDTDFFSATNGSGLNFAIVNGKGESASVELAQLYQGWARKDPGGSPSPRIASMAAVCDSDQVVLFGGRAAGGGTEGDTWIYDFSENGWSLKNPSNSPEPRSDSSLATVYTDDKVVLYGGATGSGVHLCDTWVYDLSENEWHLRSPPDNPGPRQNYGMSGAPGTGKVVIFGGSKEAGGPCAETWVYDIGENNWSRKSPALSPPARERFMMAPVSADDKVVLFGGYNGTHILGDTWVYDLGDEKWYRKIPAKNPSARRDPSLAMTEGEDRVVLYGGLVDTNVAVQDTWVYDISNDEWSSRTPSQQPSKRYGAAVATAFDTGRSVLFGGYDTGGNGWMSDTWTYSESSYHEWGHYFSPCKDLGGDSSLKTLSWNAIVPRFTDVKAQVKGGSSFTEMSGKLFTGPGGDQAKYYMSGDRLWEGHDGRWVQYKLFLSTTDTFVTPSVLDITLSYNRLPEVPVPNGPPEGSWLMNGRPTFSWNYSDADGLGQTAFAWELSATRDFARIAQNSGERRSGATSYTPDSGIADGLWYWRVRACDDDGDWGCFTAARAVMIDKTPPNSFEPIPIPAGWTSNDPQITFSTTDDASGVGRYAVSVDGGPFTKEASPCTPRLAHGRHVVTVRAYDLAGNYAEGNTTCYKDTAPPEDFTPVAEPPGWCPVSGSVLFSTNDSESGMHHYEAKTDGSEFSIQASPYPLPDLSDGSHTVVIRAYDRAQNWLERSVRVYVDSNRPLQFNALCEPAGWTRTDPRLSFNTTDTTSGLDRYEVSVDEGPFEKRESPCTLAGLSDGVHNLTVRAYDRAGNSRDSQVIAQIDRNPPVDVSLAINGGARSAPGRRVMLSVGASDSASGVDRMCFSTDGRAYTDWEPFVHRKEFDLTGGAGDKVVYVKVRDAAGNEAGAVSATIYLQPQSEGLGTTFLLLVAAILMITAITGSFTWMMLLKRKRTPK